MTTNTNEVSITSEAINKALALAKAESKKAKAGGDTTSEAGEPKQKRAKLTQEEKDAREAQRLQEREERRLAREAKKAAKPERKPAHMAKVEKAAENLPVLNDAQASTVKDILGEFSPSQVQNIISHLRHSIRVTATETAASIKLEVGQLVRIIRNDETKNVGLLGRVVESRRIRSFIQPLGMERKVYLFNSDVELVTDAQVIAEADQVFPVVAGDTQVA